MKQFPGLFNAFRFAGLLAIVTLGLVSIIGTGGNNGGGGYSPDYDGVYYHRDTDADGYGDPNVYMRSTSQPLGYVSDYTDCDDTDPAINPGAEESYYDYKDNNCDGRINEDSICTDGDGDGYYAEIGCGTVLDCVDTDADIHPDGSEFYCDGIDNDCNGLVDDGCVCTDADGDGYCIQSDLGLPVDCDDANANVYPGAPEFCGNDIDNDCDGQIDQRCPWFPDTGQTLCYNNTGPVTCPFPGDSFYGQDASYTVNPPSFTKLDGSGNELPDDAVSWVMVRDNITGLTWEVKTDDNGIHDKDNRYSWDAAVNITIANFNQKRFGGYSDWRLPTRKELLYLVKYSTYGPAIDTDYFPNSMASNYWSATKHASASTLAWYVYFNYGLDLNSNKSFECFVRAVRGGQSSASLTDNGDGTVTDDASRLMWAQATAPNTMGWQAALAWCENLSLAGYNDWRLPTIKELESIVDDNRNYPAVDTRYFSDTATSDYWSSTTVAYNPAYAWRINFSNGSADESGYKTAASYVRAVRQDQ